MRLFAHSKPDTEEDCWQPLSEHLENVAALAREFAGRFHAGPWADAAGLLHDLGKASRESQERLRGSPRQVDHSTAGAQYAACQLGPVGRLIAACIAGHHSGLSDGKSPDDACLAKRLEKTVPDISAGRVLPRPEMPPAGLPLMRQNTEVVAFQVAFFTRMLYSCLVDADFLDTERFMDPEKASWREGFPDLSELARRFNENLNARLATARPTEINRLRKQILDACIARANDPPGLFSLTVPTGGGKTLSSLALAIKHALHHGLDRIIYVVPFTSIIEQNAQVFRDVMGIEAVLEHHSGFDASRLTADGSERSEALRRFELGTENWKAPLIVTTGVQFFESLFSSRSSRCRKLHNIAGSVVILDEAQMLPVPYLLPCLAAIRELAANYETTVVLCTATQPAVTKNDEFRLGLEDVREIMPNPVELYRAFRRVTVEDRGKLSLDGLGDFLRQNEQVLCVVNTRPEAREVHERIADCEGAYHLSALMCPEHRSIRLAEIKKRLEDRLPCRLVSTRLIEAGVDIDFPIVLREIAGIDSIAQAAGRCNREGKLPGPGRVLVYTLEGARLPGKFRPPAETAQAVMQRHADPLSLDAVEDYFRELYWREADKLDRKGILDSLKTGAGELFFPFRTVAERFRFIEDAGEAVLIPFDERARSLIQQLRYAKFSGRLLRDLQRYAVQVPTYKLRELETSGAVARVQGVYPALTEYGFERLYREDVGLVVTEVAGLDVESLIV